MALAKPTTLAKGRFLIEKELGQGGMGIVYQALDRERDMRVALKTLLYMNTVNLHNFKNEFRALHDLVHPNLCAFIELIKDDAIWFLTMELIHGADFVSHVTHAPASQNSALAVGGDTRPNANRDQAVQDVQEGRLFDEQKLRKCLAGLCEGLNALHAAGKIHRDIKPSNVMVTKNDRVVLLDFGFIAQKGKQEQSEWGDIVGSPDFLAPEQADGIYVGPEADMYSVGVMLYKTLTGELPFAGPPLKVILEKQLSDPIRPGDKRTGLPGDLELLCVDLLNRDPRSRPLPNEILSRIQVEKSSSIHSMITDIYGLSQRQLFIGRQPELVVLREAYQKTVSDRSFQSVVIEGLSGVGKSALVDKFITDIAATHQQAVVLKGRCYERESAPFKAFDGIIDSLIGHIMSTPETEAAELVPADADLVIRLFPALLRAKLFANLDLSRIEIQDPHELRRRTFGAFKKLLTRLSNQRPLVITIDDMQWADDDSISLLKQLVSDSEVPPILLLLLSRLAKDEENSVLDWDSVIPNSRRRIHLQTLNNSDSQELARLLINQQKINLKVDAESVAVEADGHPLYILELVYHIALGGEEWKNLQLEQAILNRVKMLPQASQRILDIICIAGTPIKSEQLQHSSGSKSEDFLKSISLLRSNNLIRSSGPRKNHVIEPYHDRVREAVITQVTSTGSKAKIHLNIGRFFLSYFADAELEDNIFFVIQHLHAGSELITDEEEILRLAELYFLAGKKARGSSAFVSSLAYFKKSIELFSTEHWNSHYDTMFELYCSAAESAYIAGEFSLSKILVDKGIAKANSIIDKAKIYETYVLSLIADGKPMDAIDEAIGMIRQLGVKIPHRPGKLYLLLKIVTTKIRLWGKTRKQLLNLPQMENPLIVAAVRIMTRIADTAYFRLPNLNASIVIKCLELTLKYGICSFSFPAIAGWGFINTAYLKRYREGYKYGTIAIEMIHSFKDNSRAPLVLFVWAALIQHWREHLRSTLPYLLWGNETARETGEHHFLAWSGNSYCYHCLLAGVNLADVVERFDHYGKEIKDKQQGTVYLINCIMYQTALNLTGQSADPLKLNGTAYNETDITLHEAKKSLRVNTGVYHFCMLLLQLYFGAYKEAYESATELEKYADGRRGNYRSAVIYFYDSLACLKFHGDADSRTKTKLLRRVRKSQRKYQKIVACSPANHAHKFVLVKAEQARVSGKHKKARQLYDQAIAGAIKNEFAHDAALACDFAAEYYRETGETERSTFYALDALSYYKTWGAWAKEEEVKKRFNLSANPESTKSSRPGGHRARGQAESSA